MKNNLPKNICLLDIETEKCNFNALGKSKLALVGIKVYSLKQGRYFGGEYTYFLSDQMKELKKFLKDFPGIIIGYNILNFDYRVLRSLISLRGIVEKTIDIFLLIEALAFSTCRTLLSERPRGLSLDNLSKLNFGKGKTLKAKSISELWRRKEHNKVIKYNEHDCILTKRLWLGLVRGRPIKVQHFSFLMKVKGIREIRCGEDELLYLTGRRPLFSFHAWHIAVQKRKILYIERYMQERNEQTEIFLLPLNRKKGERRSELI